MTNHNSVEVVLVEDNKNDAELTIGELNRHHMANNLFHVKDGEEALEFVFATGRYAKVRDVAARPKLVLLDIDMLKVNAMEVLQKIKTDPRTHSTHVVMLTSSKEDPDIKTCYALGANSCIVKPVSFEKFAESIKKLGFSWVLVN
ncbi:MAG: response regulator [Bacteroidota bacterium]